MLKIKIYGRWIASFLLGLFCFVLTTQAVHSLVHQHEHQEKLCSKTCDKNQVHFHEVKHKVAHCNLCDFMFSPAELPVFHAFTLKNETFCYHFITPFYQVYLSAEINQTSLRGPPTV